MFTREDPDVAARMLFNLRAQDNVAAKLRFAMQWLALPTQEDWKSVTLPRPLWLLYGVLRPARLGMQTAASLARALRAHAAGRYGSKEDGSSGDGLPLSLSAE